jgi:hypothetical protein
MEIPKKIEHPDRGIVALVSPLSSMFKPEKYMVLLMC